MTSDRPIGGEFEIRPLDLAGSIGEGTASVWPDFGCSHVLRCDTGRSALALALADWRGRRTGAGIIWLPHYICPSVVETVQAANFRISWYQDLPGVDSLALALHPGDDDLVLIVHYFGFLNSAALDWARVTDKRSWGLIEDAVQAPYSQGIGKSGDYVIASLRKWYASPDGAVVCSRWPMMDQDSLLASDEGFVSRRIAAKILRGTMLADERFLEWIKESEARLAPNLPRQPSWFAEQILSWQNVPELKARRRANWAVLADGLLLLSYIRPLYDILPDGTVPLTFPVLVQHGYRDALRRHLAVQGIFCPVHWLDLVNAPADARRVSETILSIPIDQRYNDSDMKHILQLLKKFQVKD